MQLTALALYPNKQEEIHTQKTNKLNARQTKVLVRKKTGKTYAQSMPEPTIIRLYTAMVHNTAMISSANLLSYPPATTADLFSTAKEG